MRKYYLLLLLLFLIIPYKVNAYYDVLDERCTLEVRTELQKTASNISYRLYKVGDENITYNLELYNVPGNIRITDIDGNEIVDVINLKPGKSITLNLYANENSYCNGFKVTSLYVGAPYYNKYYKDKLCEGNDDYYLCNENTEVNLSYEEFKKELTDHISDKDNKKQNMDVVTEKKGVLELINEYIYIAYIVIFIILLILLIKLIKFVKRKKKDIGIL